jgi:hypothetical protein
MYEYVSVALTDVAEPERSRLLFGGYTYREVERRAAVECDAIIDSFRSP